jgi:hypothetical protein
VCSSCSSVTQGRPWCGVCHLTGVGVEAAWVEGGADGAGGRPERPRHKGYRRARRSHQGEGQAGKACQWPVSGLSVSRKSVGATKATGALDAVIKERDKLVRPVSGLSVACQSVACQSAAPRPQGRLTQSPRRGTSW